MRDRFTDMDRRSAWRVLDFARDIFMHHRKFTPFQKFIFVSLLLGVVCVGLCRNWWGLMLATNYGLSMYSAIKILQLLVNKNVFLPSDRLLQWIENVELFVEGVVSAIFIPQSKTSPHKHERPCTNILGEEASSSRGEVGQLASSHGSTTTTVDDQHRLESEIRQLTKLIHKDFFIAWYDLFTKDELVWSEAEVILIMIFDSLQGRLVKANIPDVLKSIMILFRTHVHNLKEAEFMYKAQTKRRKSLSRSSNAGLLKPDVRSRKTLEECYESKTEIHPALKSAEFELAYQRAIVDCLLLHLLPRELLEIKTLMTALKEILSVNLFQNLIVAISDPIFLYEKVILITSDEEPLLCKETESPIHVVETEPVNSNSNVQSILVKKDSKTNVTVKDERSGLVSNSNYNSGTSDKTSDTGIPTVKWKDDTKTFPVSKVFCCECNRLCSRDRDKISSRPHTCSLGSEDDARMNDNLSINVQGSKLSESDSNISKSRPLFELSVSDSDSEVFKEDGQGLIDSTKQKHIPSLMGDQSKGSSDLKVYKGAQFDRDLTLASSETEKEGSYQNTPDDEKGIGNFQLPNMPSIFPKFSLNLPNPLSSLPNPLNLGPLKLSPSDLNTQTEEESKDVKKSKSSGLFSRRARTPVSPRIEADMNGATDYGIPSHVFEDIRITSTESAKEPGSSSLYTLYEIEYDAIYQSDTKVFVHKTGRVKRRFREFVNLQTILEDNSEFKKYMKDVKGPKRMLPLLPFGNMGRETLEGRRTLLENFLLALIKKELICNSEEMKQFLGYSGDGHIAFVRKASETSIPRIDQRLVKTMSGVFDKIVEGLPSLPQQIPRMMPSFESPDDKKIEPEQLEDKDNIEVDFTVDSEEMLYESAIDKFMYERLSCNSEENGNLNASGNTSVDLGTSMLSWQSTQMNTSGSSSSLSTQSSQFSRCIGASQVAGASLGTGTASPSCVISDFQGEEENKSDDLSNEDVCPLSDALLDILTELLRGQDNWMCRDTVMKSTRLAFGKGLNRYLQSQINDLTSEEMNSMYLKKFREAFWPDDVFSTNQTPQYTDFQREAIMKQAHRCLGDFLPGALKLLLGMDDFEHILNEAIHSVKYEQLNRHLWYSIFDILIEEVFPEIGSHELQRKLSSAVEKT